VSRGIIFPTHQFLPLIDLARLAEERGFDMVWTTESRDRDGFIRLAPIAQATSRIGLGTGIAYAFTRHPIATAAIAADLDELSNGRMLVGLGAGTKYMRKLWYEVDWEHPATQMKEYVQVMKAMWRAAEPPQPVAYHGRFYNFDIARFWRPNMVRPEIPVYAAALNPGMIRAAAEAYDGIALFPLAIAKPYFDGVVLPNIEKGAKRAGKSLKDVKIAAWLITVVAKNSAEARRAARHHIAFYLSTRSYGVVPDYCGWEKEKLQIQEIFNRNRQDPDTEAMADAVSDEMVDALTLAGTPDEVRRKAKDFEQRAGMIVFEGGEMGISAGELVESCEMIIDALGSR
jgi:probable F420-dependent oxidoreductase